MVPIPSKSNMMGKNKIGIEEILDLNNPEMEIYRDILKYFRPKLICNYNGGRKRKKDNLAQSFDTVFRIRELTNWLLGNHVPFKGESDLNDNLSNRAHSKNSQIETRVRRLMLLGLIVRVKNTVRSNRNPNISTYEYDLSIRGSILTLKLWLQDLDQGTREYAQVVRVLLEQYFHSIPEGQDDISNFYYIFVKNLLEKCINSQAQILVKFFSLVSLHFNDFYSLRCHFNNYIFYKVTTDKWFNVFLNHELKGNENRELIKMQIKLDVESEIEKKSYKILNMPLYSKTLILGSIDVKNQRQMTFKEYKKRPKNPGQFYLFNYEIKKSWDSLRYANVGNNNKISCINECEECGYIFVCLVSIEGFQDIKCEKCNHSRIQLFEFEKDLGNSLVDKSE